MIKGIHREFRALAGSVCVTAVLACAGQAIAQDATHGLGVINDDGWTVLVPSPDTRFIYVSSTMGDDSNDGLTPQTPKRSLDSARRTMRNNHPDWLMLRRGDTFEEGLRIGTRGRSMEEPAVITAYGQGPRPVIQPTTSDTGLFVGSSNWGYFAIRGVEFRAPDGGTGRGGLRIVADTGEGFLLEDCKVDGFKDNVQLIGKESAGGFSDAQIRRNVIVDAFAPFGGHSQGIYADTVDELLILENVIDHNGWSYDDADPPTIFNHNIYIQSTCGPAHVEGNIIARGSSHGLQARPGGLVRDNLFLQNALAMFVSRGQSEVTWNVILEGRDIDPQNPRGFGIEVKPIVGGLVAHNIIANRIAESDDGYGIQLHNSNNGVDDFRVEVRDNIVYNWTGTMFKVRHPDIAIYNDIVVENNRLIDDFGTSQILSYEPTQFDADIFQFVGNEYASNLPETSWFSVSGSTTSLDDWMDISGENPGGDGLGRGGGGSIMADPTRSVEEYTQVTFPDIAWTIDDSSDFLVLAREQAADNWDPSLTAEEVNDWIREGFGIQQ